MGEILWFLNSLIWQTAISLAMIYSLLALFRFSLEANWLLNAILIFLTPEKSIQRLTIMF